MAQTGAAVVALPGVGAAGADDVGGILGGVVEVGVDDPDARGAVGADAFVGGADEGGAAGGVVVEREDDAVDAEVGESFELALG